MWRRPILVLLVGAAAVAAPLAQAARPVIAPAPSEDLVDPSTCSFPVSVHFTVNGETAKTFTSGKTLVTGPLFVEFSANGKTVSANISGPVTVTPTSDGSVTIVGRGVGGGPLMTADGVTIGLGAGPVATDPETGIGALIHGAFRLDICEALAPS
jgi:hypothetical protein